MSAVQRLAKAEVRRRWPALLALGLLAAMGGAMATSSVALARRTTTSYDRLRAATAPADAQVFVNAVPGGPAAEAVAGLPGVEQSWTVRLGVAAIGEEKVYLGMIGSEDAPPPGLFRPLVVRGRAPDPEAADEVAVSEDFADELADAGIHWGEELPLRFLTGDDYRSFDSGLDVPSGPAVDVHIVGTYQMTGGTEGVPPVITSPGLVRDHPDALDAARVVFLRLADGRPGVADLRRQVDELGDDFSVPANGGEFDPFLVEVPTDARAEFDTTARVLGGGLAALAGVAALVALFLLVQGFNRYHGAANEAESVQQALGVTAGQLLGVRLAAAVPVALLAGGLVLCAGVATAGVEPLGSLRAFEPHPGRAVNVAVLAGGSAVTGLVVLSVVAVTMAVSTRRARRQRHAGEAGTRRASRWPAATPSAIAARFTLGTDRAASPMRSAMVGVAVAVAGVAATMVFATSLDRLVGTPARYGWGGDFAIVDADAAAAHAVADDPDVAGATRFTQTTVRFGDDRRYVSAYEDLTGDAPWWISTGRLPTAPDQVMLEPRLAADLGVGVGDRINAGPGVGLTVVGIGVGPNFSSGTFGRQALVTPAGAERLEGTAPFTEIVVDVAPGRPVAEVMNRYGDDYELAAASPPAEIDNLSQLGRLPGLLAAFLAVIGVGAVANALWVSVRRRRRDLAVLRVLGHAPGQVGTVVLTMAVLATGIGVAVGLPLGLAVGRTLWRVVAENSAVEGDALVTVPVLLGVPLGALAVAVTVAVPAAWRAGHRRPARVLRTE